MNKCKQANQPGFHKVIHLKREVQVVASFTGSGRLGRASGVGALQTYIDWVWVLFTLLPQIGMGSSADVRGGYRL